MVPPLSKGTLDGQKWNEFVDSIKNRYKDDVQVEVKPNYINFKAGNEPKIPFEGHKLLRFSSEVSGTAREVTRIKCYITTVSLLAKLRFGSQARTWNECSDKWGEEQREDGADSRGKYGWDEVKESIRSYEQVCHLFLLECITLRYLTNSRQVDDREIPTTIGHLINGVDPLRDLDIPLFEIKEIPGKGKGLIVRVNISKGTRLLCEKPLLIVSPKPREQLEQLVVSKLKAMPKASQRQFLSLHNNNPGKYPFSGIVKTNALPCGSRSLVGGVYPTICLINDSCISNAHNSWNPKKEHETIHAIRPIKAGEEITIRYDHVGLSTERQASLKDSFGFTCTCTICTLPPARLQASDDRRKQIKDLDQAIGDPYRMMSKPQESLRNCNSLLRVLREEFDDCALLARLYYDAFQISIVHGDQARASVFAERGYKARIICEGEDSLETAKMKALALKPMNHSSFGAYSTKWKSLRDEIPKGLGVMQFESGYSNRTTEMWLVYGGVHDGVSGGIYFESSD
jgi:hypothetical protein